jgi:hypothetical protein
LSLVVHPERLRIPAYIGRRTLPLLPFALAPAGRAAATGLVWLVTDREAALPAVPAPGETRAVTRGPAIRYVHPLDRPVRAREPFWLRLEFAARGGARIDPQATRVTLLRGPHLDLSSRVRPFLSDAALDIGEALAPPGSFAFRIVVADDQGRSSGTVITLDVR